MEASLQPYIDYRIDPGPLKVLDINVMHGANYFSAGPVVVLRLDLGEYDEVFTNQIPGLPDRLQQTLPSLAHHHCSVGQPEGFLMRVREGTLLGHVTEHTAIELQTLAGMDVSYGKTRSSTQVGVYNVVFRFFDEVAGIYAGKAAVNLVNSLLLSQPFDAQAIVRNLVEIREQRMLGPSTAAIVEEAKRRNIPWLRMDQFNLVQLGTGKYQKRIRATITSDTSFLGVDAADDKHLTTMLLQDAGIPIPETEVAEDIGQVLTCHRRLARPIVIKPLEGSLGRGVSVNLNDEPSIQNGYQWATGFYDKVIVQPYVAGNSYRLLVINHRFVAAVQQIPPAVTGDGQHTISQLVDALNLAQGRQVGDKAQLTVVEIDEITARILQERGSTPDTVLPAGTRLLLKLSGSLRLGGEAADVTGSVHPENRFVAERASKVIGLNVAGVDIVAPDIGRTIMDGSGAVIEVNAAPDFRMHLAPTQGQPRPVAEPLLDMLFPAKARTRIPVLSVTGTLGKTTTVNLLAHCLKLARHQVGITSTEGLFISGKCLMEKDCTYPEHVALVLKDPTVDCAVLETSREGILRRGLGYEWADVGVILNMYDDHVGSDDIKYIEDLAYAKAVVAEQVYPQGSAVLNADNDLVLNMAERVRSQMVLFTRNPGHPKVRAHISKGSRAVVLQGSDVLLYQEGKEARLFDITEAPLAFGGRARLNYDNILGAVGALFAMDLPLERIRYGLKSFYPDPQMLPGRMNLIPVKDAAVLVDYAHNKESYLGLGEFIKTQSGRKIGVMDAAGDRLDEDIMALGQLAARMFDELVLYEGFDRRGRPEGAIVELLKRGSARERFPAEKINTFFKPEQAWEYGLGQATAGTLVVILSGRSRRTLEAVERFKHTLSA